MDDLARAVRLLREGKLVAFPTETVYGLGADAANPEALAKIFAAKGRPADHPLIVHLPDAGHLDRWARDVPEAARRLAAAFWPGPLTLILRKAPGVPELVTGGQDTVGVRIPGHPLALQLLRAFGAGIAAPSANRFGRISPTTAQHVRDELGDRVALVLDGGACQVGIESTILDLSATAPRILRPGRVSPSALASVLGAWPVTGAAADGPRVSGSLEAHYAPTTPLELVTADGLIFAVREALARDERLGVPRPPPRRRTPLLAAGADRTRWVRPRALRRAEGTRPGRLFPHRGPGAPRERGVGGDQRPAPARGRRLRRKEVIP